MSTTIDANLFVGRYPFRSCAAGSVAECRAMLGRIGFDGGVVSPLEAIFEEDSFAAEERLAGSIQDAREFVHFKVVNPAQPWWLDDLERALAELGVRGVRLCSLYHGYPLGGGEAAAVFRFAAERDLPVLVTCRMQDVRMQWLLHAVEPTQDEVAHVLDAFPSNRIILAGLSFRWLVDLADKINGRANVLCDTSRLQGPWQTFEKLAARLDLSRVAFGSLWPISLPDCPLEQLRRASVGEDAKHGIRGANLCRLLGESA